MNQEHKISVENGTYSRFSGDNVQRRSHDFALILVYEISVDDHRFSTVVGQGNHSDKFGFILQK
jgi:hypothetical protein